MKRGCKEDEDRLFFSGTQLKTGGHGHKQAQEAPVNLRKHFCSKRGTGCPEGLQSLPPWRYWKDIWTRATGSGWPCFRRGTGQDDLQKSLPQPFCDTVINANKKCQYKALIQIIAILLIGILKLLGCSTSVCLFVCPNWDFYLVQIFKQSGQIKHNLFSTVETLSSLP